MIETRVLTKTHPRHAGVFSLSLKVSHGEIVGLLGMPKSGKTTVVRQLSGLEKSGHGWAQIGQLDCFTQSSAISRSLGYLPQGIALPESMKPGTFLRLLARMHGLRDTRRRDELVKKFELNLKTPAHKLTHSEKKRLAIVAAFMHDPQVYLLDEPLNGLEPNHRLLLLNLLAEERVLGKTILLTGTSFDDMNLICDRIALLEKGRLLAMEEVDALRAVRRLSFSVTVSRGQDILAIRQSGLEIRSYQGETIEVVVQGNYPLFLSTLAGCDIVGIRQHEQPLSEQFSQLYAKGASL